MHLGDTFEFGNTDFSVASEAVPMINVVCLSNIWLPSHLLQNRGKFIDPYLNKPAIFRTLEKPVIADCFSTYSESSLQNNEPKDYSSVEDDSSDDFSQADMLDILNDYSVTSTTDYLAESLNKENSTLCSKSTVGSNHLQNHSSYQQSSLNNSCEANLQEYEFSVAEEAISVAKASSECNSFNANHITVVKAISGSIKDSLEEVYNSEDEDLNQDNANLTQREICNDVDFKNSLDHSSDILSSRIIQENELDRHQCSSSIATVERSDCIQNYELNDNFSVEEFKIDDDAQNFSVEDVVKYPIAYKKPALEETVVKQKKQKERKKKAPKKNQLLHASEDNLSSDDDCYNNFAPAKDEFYEHVMRQQCFKSYVSEYPSLYKESQISFIDSTEKIYPFNKQTSGFWETDSKSTTTNDTYEQTVSTNSNEFQVMEKEVIPEQNNGSKNFSTIIIENIPLDVTEEHLHSILMGYGELKKFSLEPCGGFLKAELKMDFNCDVDWIIECLNGNQPFGATEDVLKCYKLC